MYVQLEVVGFMGLNPRFFTGIGEQNYIPMRPGMSMITADRPL